MEKNHFSFSIDSTMLDICSQRSLTTSNSLNLISPMFPNEYPNNINCTCTIESNAIIDVEVKVFFSIEIHFF